MKSVTCFPLIPEVLCWIIYRCQAIVIALVWLTQSWFLLLSLATDHPCQLPPTWALHRQLGLQVFSPGSTQSVSAHMASNQVSLTPKGLPSGCGTLDLLLLNQSTTACGNSSVSGLQNRAEILHYLRPPACQFPWPISRVKQFPPATIVGYHTTIVNTVEKMTGVHFTEEHLTSNLLAQFEVETQHPHRSIPGWDLSLVLHALHHHPYKALA